MTSAERCIETMDNAIKRIQKNYRRICPLCHQNNQIIFDIEQLDNPGWAVEVYLGNFDITKIDFKDIKYDNGDEDWLHILIEGDYFEGYGDITKLEQILTIFCELFFPEDRD